MYKIFSMLVCLVATSATGKCLTVQTEGESASQQKMPIIISRGYVRLEKNEASKLLAQRGLKENISEYSASAPSTDRVAVGVAEISEVDYGEINTRVTEIKNNLCPLNPEVTYEVWLQKTKGTSGGLSWVVSLIYSASSEGGMKAIINCSHNGNKTAKKAD